jgi:hypothetical protein
MAVKALALAAASIGGFMLIQPPVADSPRSGVRGLLEGSDFADWLSKPLCCRYAFAEFKTLRLPVRDGDAVREVAWRWALGLFKQDEYEVLSAWPAQAPPADVADELHKRGIEHLKVICADGGMDCTSIYPDAISWPSVGAPHVAGLPATAGVFGPRRHAALESAAAAAARLQASIERAIKRRAPFADESSAAAFLALTLENADRRLQKVRQEPPRTRPRAPATMPSGPVSPSRSA